MFIPMDENDEYLVKQIEKNIRKRHKEWSDEEINSAAVGVLTLYKETNKDMLEKRKAEDKERLEHDLDREHFHLWLDWQEREYKKQLNQGLNSLGKEE